MVRRDVMVTIGDALRVRADALGVSGDAMGGVRCYGSAWRYRSEWRCSRSAYGALRVRGDAIGVRGDAIGVRGGAMGMRAMLWQRNGSAMVAQ